MADNGLTKKEQQLVDKMLKMPQRTYLELIEERTAEHCRRRWIAPDLLSEAEEII